MGSIIGFSLFDNLEEGAITRLTNAQRKALTVVDHLEQKIFTYGTAQLVVWGHGGISDQLHTLPDGSVLALIGSPHNKVTWKDAQEKILSNNFDLPWEGRVILLRVSVDGKRWTLWNDWLGSIPVFHAEVGNGRIASTLEPATVSAAGYTPDDFYLPGLISLMINGHYISDWTLYKGMKVIPPDSIIDWDEKGFRAKQVWSVKPSQSRWETGWDELVDEMYELSHNAIANTMKAQSTWTLPLSSGLDSRLIAAVAADVGANVHTYAWGAYNTTDVVYSRQIAKALGFPWKRINLPKDFLVKYTPQWADLFGSAMHFHGMYQMAFLDAIKTEPKGAVLSGFIGDTLSGDGIQDVEPIHLRSESYQLCVDWYSNWRPDQVRVLFKRDIEDSLRSNSLEYKRMVKDLDGAFFQKMMVLELWNRQRFFTSFQSTLSDHWRGVANPFMDRAYVRFCLSLPRAALDNRRLLKDVYRRYYGRLAVIPGTYASDPFIPTGRYLFMKRIAKQLPQAFKRGPFAGFENIQLRMDMDSARASGKDALWPLFDASSQLADWLNFSLLEQKYRDVIDDRENFMALRQLQSVQAFSYRLI